MIPKKMTENVPEKKVGAIESYSNYINTKLNTIERNIEILEDAAKFLQKVDVKSIKKAEGA